MSVLLVRGFLHCEALEDTMDRPPITPNMRIRDVIAQYPQTIAVLHRYGIRCEDCHASRYESVGHGARVHDIDVVSLLTDLNHAVGTANGTHLGVHRTPNG